MVGKTPTLGCRWRSRRRRNPAQAENAKQSQFDEQGATGSLQGSRSRGCCAKRSQLGDRAATGSPKPGVQEPWRQTKPICRGVSSWRWQVASEQRSAASPSGFPTSRRNALRTSARREPPGRATSSVEPRHHERTCAAPNKANSGRPCPPAHGPTVPNEANWTPEPLKPA